MKKLLVLLMVVFMISLVSAQPPFDPLVVDFGVEIAFPQFDVVPAGQDYTFHFHTTNSSNGVILDDTDLTCSYHLYNATTGGHLVEFNYDVGMESNNIDWEVPILAGNLSSGMYGYLFGCNSTSAGIGGEVEGAFEATSTGVSLSLDKSIIYVGLLAILIFLFLVNIGGITLLPKRDNIDESGNLISINQLKHLRPILYVVGWLLLLSIIYIGANIAFAYLGATLFANLLFTIFQIMMVLTYPMVLIWFIYLFYSFFKDRKMEKLIQRGVKDLGGGNI